MIERHRWLFALVCCSALLLIAASHRQPEVGPHAALKDALDTALDDERRAIAFYEAVMETHGERRPFSNIVHAERRHASALLGQYARLGLTPPADAWQDHEFDVPARFADACDASIVAELDNAQIYDALIDDVSDAEVRQVFERLRAASLERHLPAFRRHSSGWRAVEFSDLTTTQATQKEHADSARVAMFDALIARLSSALKSDGTAHAISVCSTAAPEIAVDVSARFDVRIGRTSHRLRNPDNLAPAWARLALHEKPTEAVIMTDRQGRVGVLSPIHLKTTCVQCHGPTEEIAPDVIEQLRQHYPHDEATGFEVGELRGWFWVEPQ